MQTCGGIFINEGKDVEFGQFRSIEKSTTFMLGEEGWDGEDAICDFALDAVGAGNVFGVGKDHGDEFFGGEWVAVYGEAYS